MFSFQKKIIYFHIEKSFIFTSEKTIFSPHRWRCLPLVTVIITAKHTSGKSYPWHSSESDWYVSISFAMQKICSPNPDSNPNLILWPTGDPFGGFPRVAIFRCFRFFRFSLEILIISWKISGNYLITHFPVSALRFAKIHILEHTLNRRLPFFCLSK